jgi:RNA polymerase sigma-70 factor (ECF subfamily)
MATDPDQDILNLLDAGNRNAAIRLLMQRHGKAVYRYIRSELHNQPISDDVHSRVFIEADRDLAHFSRRSLLRSWLFGIARHRVLDASKSQQLSLSKNTPLDDIDAPIDVAPAGELLDDARMSQALLDCLQRLADKVREAVQLRYQGLSFEEIAELFDEKPGTVQARVKRALPVLRDCIEKRTSGRV